MEPTPAEEEKIHAFKQALALALQRITGKTETIPPSELPQPLSEEKPDES